MRLPLELRTFCSLAAGLTALSWLVVFIATTHGLPYPYNWPLFRPGNSFFDYWDYYWRFGLLHTNLFFTAPGYPFTYMAPGVVLYKFFYVFGWLRGFVVYLMVACAASVFALFAVRRQMLLSHIAPRSINGFVFILLLTSFPIAFCVERGNLEIIIAAGLAAGTWAYWKEKTWTAAILWGLFGSVKIYPLLLLALFLSARQFRQLGVALATAAVSTVLALLYIGPNLHDAYAGIALGIAKFLNMYALTFDQGGGFDHSAFALLKLTLTNAHVSILVLLRLYLIGMAALGTVLYAVRIRKLPRLNQLLIYSACAVLLPPTSFDYTLVQLYAPFIACAFLAIKAATEEARVPGLTLVCTLFAFVFTPTNFLFHAGHSFSAQIKCSILIALLVLAVVHPLEIRRRRVVGEALAALAAEPA